MLVYGDINCFRISFFNCSFLFESMNKDLKYKKLLDEIFSSLNLFHWIRIGYNKVTGKNPPRSKYRKNINYKICLYVFKPDRYLNDTLSDRELKALAFALNLPYQTNQKELIENLRKYIYENAYKLFDQIEKEYLDKLDIEHLSAFWIEYTQSKDIDLVLSRENSDEEIRKHIKAHLRVSFHSNVTRASKFKKDYYSGNLEYNKIFEKFTALYSGVLSSDNLSREIDNLTKDIFADTDNIYKFNVDKNYNLDKSGMGGPYHRLHDESHTLHEMAQKVKDTLPNDSNVAEFIAFVNEFAKDVQTTMGLPIISVKKETFDNFHSFLKPLGVDKNDLYDFLTYNFQEVLNVCFIVAYYLFPSTRKNKEKLGSVYGFLSVTGSFGNPLALIVLAITLIISVIKNDFKDEEQRKSIITGAAKSAGLTILIKFAIGFFDIDSISKLIGFLVGIVLIVLLYKKGIKKVEINKLKKEIEKELNKLSKKSKFIIEQTKLITQ